MKAEELMIGDYVQDLAGDLCQVIVIDRHVAQVETLTGVHQGDTTRYLHESDGVPLTSEILEKNFGKHYNRGGFHCYSFSKDEKIHYMVEDRHPSAAPDNRIVFCRVPGVYTCDVNYVHELQHTLRQCGIDKDIEL